MKIVIPGGSGQVGTILARWFHAQGHEVVVLSRSPASAPWRQVNWDARSVGDWVRELDGADVVINLAGRSVNCRYSAGNRSAILASRVESTRVLARALATVTRPPGVWLQSSTATIYSHRFDAPNDEAQGLIDNDASGAPDTWGFSVGVAKAWENATTEVELPNTRIVLLRSAMIMSPDPGGVFDTLLGLVRSGLGGRSGDGRQFVSWIHERDFIAAVERLIATPDLRGAINVASPHPLPNAEFMRGLRRAWGARFGLPAAKWMLEIGAIFLRTETELVLKSRRVVPGILIRDGFAFAFPTWPEAAQDLVAQWRADLRSLNATE